MHPHSLTAAIRSLCNAPQDASISRRSTTLEHLLQAAPVEKRAELRDLCHWLLCCKKYWPNAARETPSGSITPFQMYRRNQSLHTDRGCIRRTVYNILGEKNRTLAKKIEEYALTGSDADLRTLQGQSRPSLPHPFTTIDPSDAPVDWPRECLVWAVRTMNMACADLSRADLSDTVLSGIDFNGANMFGCVLRNAIARGCNLEHADLNYALMEGIDLSNSKVKNATFQYANLSCANLTGLGFSTDEDNLRGAIFDDAILDDIGLDISPYAVAPDGAYALREGMLPRALDQLVRKNMESYFGPHDSDTDGDYLASHTDNESSGNVSDCRPAAAGGNAPQTIETSRMPAWQTALCCSLLLFPTQTILSMI